MRAFTARTQRSLATRAGSAHFPSNRARSCARTPATLADAQRNAEEEAKRKVALELLETKREMEDLQLKQWVLGEG